MTEQEWLTSSDPLRMLNYLLVDSEYMERSKHDGFPYLETRLQRYIRLQHDGQYQCPRPSVTDRKLLLFARAIEPFWEGRRRLGVWGEIDWAGVVAEALRREEVGPPEKKATLLRDIFGNPFRQMPIYWTEQTSYIKVGEVVPYPKNMPSGVTLVRPDGLYKSCSWLTWNDGIVRKLAQGIYDKHRFQDMPILGDALEDAGCEDEAILNHCRGREKRYCLMPRGEPSQGEEWMCLGWEESNSPHVRGCWVIDLLLGKQ